MRGFPWLLLCTAVAASGAGCANREAIAERPSCGLAANLGDLVLPGTAEATAALGQHSDVTELALSAPLSPDLDPPILQLSATAGHGVFQNGISVGQFLMTASDADPLNCSFCVTLVGPISERERRPKYTYAARAGRLELTELSGKIRGILRDVELREMHYSTQAKGFVDTRSGCTTRIASVAFELPLESFLPK